MTEQQQNQTQATQMPKLLQSKPAHATIIATNIDIEQAVNKHFKNLGLVGYYGCKVVNEARLDLFFTEKIKYVHGKAGNVNSALIKKLDLVNTLDVDFEGLFAEVLGGTFVGDMYELQNGYEEINDGSNMSGFIVSANLPLAIRVISGMDINNPDVIEVEKVVSWNSQKGNSLFVKYIRYNVEEMERIQNLFGPINNNRGKGGYNAFRSANNQ